MANVPRQNFSDVSISQNLLLFLILKCIYLHLLEITATTASPKQEKGEQRCHLVSWSLGQSAKKRKGKELFAFTSQCPQNRRAGQNTFQSGFTICESVPITSINLIQAQHTKIIPFTDFTFSQEWDLKSRSEALSNSNIYVKDHSQIFSNCSTLLWNVRIYLRDAGQSIIVSF